MKIKQLHLQNYGRFEHLDIDFATQDEHGSNVTVIVGNNGAGKSQILQGLATGLSWFVARLKAVNSNGFSIDPILIKNGKNDALIQIISDFGENNYKSDFSDNLLTEWQISSVKEGRVNQFKSEISQLELATVSYQQQLMKKEEYNLPLVVFYPVERTILQYVEAEIISHGYDQIEGYYASLDGASIDFSDFLKWFRNKEDIENQKKVLSINRLDYLKFENDKTMNLLNELYDVDNLSSDSELDISLEELKALRLKLGESLKNIENLRNFHASSMSHELSLFFVKRAIEEFTNFKNPHIRRQGTPTMIVEKDGEELDVNQLSQGEKSLLALVGDIARRLAILNPSLENPLEGEGVVMIDEVDLHLHPKWQHDLIDKLVKTFPNVQFILTTHSPHIVSDRNDILVYSLDDGELEEITNIYGEDANTVLTKVFDVPIRDKDAQKDFDDIAHLIHNKQFDTAEEKILKLEKEMPENLELLRYRLHLTQAQLAQKQEG